jgi:hypothetical protein
VPQVLPFHAYREQAVFEGGRAKASQEEWQRALDSRGELERIEKTLVQTRIATIRHLKEVRDLGRLAAAVWLTVKLRGGFQCQEHASCHIAVELERSGLWGWSTHISSRIIILNPPCHPLPAVLQPEAGHRNSHTFQARSGLQWSARHCIM